MIKKAMILAAGFGKRIQPLTFNCPKPLLKIGKETLLSNTLKFLEQYKISQIVIREALEFNKSLIIENFIEPNRLRLPLSRNILERYYN